MTRLSSVAAFGALAGFGIWLIALSVAGRLGQESPAPDELLESDAGRGVVFDDEHALARDGGGCRRRGVEQCHFYIVSALVARRKALRDCAN